MSIRLSASWFRPGLGLAVACAVLCVIAGSSGFPGSTQPGPAEEFWLFETEEAPAGEVCSLAASPRGELLAAGTRGGEVWVWESSKQLLIARWRAHGKQVTALAFFHDSCGLFTAGADGQVRRWDVGDSAEAAGGWPSGEVVTALAASPDGRTLAAASGSRVGLYDAAEGCPLHGGPLPGPPSPTRALAFSPDGRSLAAGGGGDNAVRVWALGAGGPALRHTLGAGGDNWVRGLAYAADGVTLLSLDTEGVVHAWGPGGALAGRRRAAGPVPLPASLGAGGRLVLTGGDPRCAARLSALPDGWWR